MVGDDIGEEGFWNWWSGDKKSNDKKKKISWKKIIIFGILFILIIGVIWMYFSGNLGFFLTKADVALSESDSWAGIKKSFGGIFAFVKNPAEAITKSAEWKSPVVEESETRRFVEFKDFESEKSKYKFGEDITLRGCAKIYGLQEKDFNAKFSCGNDDVEGEVKLYNKDDTKIEIDRDTEEVYCIACDIKGFEKSTDSGATKVLAKTINFKINYEDFITKAGLPLWTVDKEEFDKYSAKGENIFEKYKITSKYLLSDNTAVSYVDEGPVSLGLGVFVQQPMTEGEYVLGINLKENDAWRGDLKAVKEIRINLPGNFEAVPEKCKGFVVDNNKLVMNEKTGLDSYKEIKQKLKKKEALNHDLWCDVLLYDVEETLTKLDITAYVVYDYEFVKKTTVNVFESDSFL